MATTGNKDIERGDIYWVNLDPTVGTETQKTRPALVISNNIQNKASPRVIVLPITSNVKNIFRFHAEIKVKNKKAKAMADQVRTVDKIRLTDFIGKCTHEEMIRVEEAIRIAIDLD
jgi:mRNA interferase MazF